MGKRYCLDTHCLVWYFTGQTTLSKEARQVLDKIFLGEAEAFLSAITFLETLHLSFKKKDFRFADFVKKLRRVNIKVVPLDQNVLSACYKLPENFEIHDRVIAATAKITNSVLITKNQTLRSFSSLKTLW